MNGDAHGSVSPVDQLLDRLLVLLPGTPRQIRIALAEAEAHLAQLVEQGLHEGLSQLQAEAEAVRRFGPADLLAADERRWRRTSGVGLVRAGAVTALYLCLIAGLALGASGLLVALVGWLGGSTSIVNISESTHLSTTDCTRWLRNDPQAATCYQAALSDWASETVVNRLAIGGLALIVVLIILRRRRRRPKRVSRLLPPLVVSSIGLSVFGTTALWLIGQGSDTLLIGANGAGQYLGSAPPVLAAALWFATRLVHELRAQPEQPRQGEVI